MLILGKLNEFDPRQARQIQQAVEESQDVPEYYDPRLQILDPEQMREEIQNPSMQGPSKPYEDEDFRMKEVETYKHGGMCRGAGKAVTGKGFKGVF